MYVCPSIFVKIPEVEYDNRAEFVSLAYRAQHTYIQYVCKSLQEECLKNEVLRSRFVQVQEGPELPRFMPIFDEHSFLYLQDRGTDALLTLTKQQGNVWCTHINRFIIRHLLRAAKVYTDTISYYAMYGPSIHQWPYSPLTYFHFKEEQCLEILKEEVHFLFSGGMPLCVASKEGFVGQLLRNNFHLIIQDFTWELMRESTRIIKFPNYFFLSRPEYFQYLIVLCMGLHARLGKNSVLYMLQDDLLSRICMMVFSPCNDTLPRQIYENDEQWLF